MATTLNDIRYNCEEILPQGVLTNEKVIKWCNEAQADFMLRVFVPGSTTQILNTTALSYTLSPTTIREIRRLRLQSDLDNKINRPYNPVFSFYNGVFEVPTPFPKADTLLIDFYGFLKIFTKMDDVIDLPDRFKPLYTSYVESQYYISPEAVNAMPGHSARYVPWLLAFQQYDALYRSMKKQVADFYDIAMGIEKPMESGW
jgi:hypothetical protein